MVKKDHVLSPPNCSGTKEEKSQGTDVLSQDGRERS